MTYAGRLDPLAEGILVLLAGDDCMKKDEFTSLTKEYEVEILLGFSTDTYDLLGLVENSLEMLPQETREFSAENSLTVRSDELTSPPETKSLRKFPEIIKTFVGKIDQKYPPYSSRTVNGKPLWQWAREGKLGEIKVPTHEVLIESIEIISENYVTAEDIKEKLQTIIPKVKGDFRQAQVLELWDSVLTQIPENKKFPLVTIRVVCGSGTYMRVIAHDIGEMLGIPALACHIKRTKIGDFSLPQKES